MLASQRQRRVRARFGINLFGYVTGNLGLGVAARNTANVLAALDVPTVLNDLDPGSGRAGHDTSHEVVAKGESEETPYAINLFHLNAWELAHHLRTNPRLVRRNRVNVAVPFWELPILPPDWIPTLDAMDVILAPSRFIQDAVLRALPGAVCLLYRQAVFIPDEIAADRGRWGIPESVIAFVTSFDLASDIERKNPEAVVRAFQKAFPGRSDVCLLLKVNSAPPAGGMMNSRFGALMATVEADPRIRVIAETLTYRDVLTLYASADVLVSLHRSEGLGLSVLEAMALGRPVIATGWSGNMDYMTPENSFAVGYNLIPVRSDHPAYGRAFAGEVRWADPDESECAAYMQTLAGDAALRVSMGERARQDVAQRRALVEGGEVVSTLREALSPTSRVWSRHGERRTKLKRIARGSLRDRVRWVYWWLPQGVRTPIDRARRRLGSAA